VEDQESVHSLYRYLEERFPDLKTKSFRILVNDEVINSERKLEAGDEVLLLPPHDGT
jgi:molybdopterin converting factor small subunit